MDLANERGFIETFMLATYMVIFLSMLAFLMASGYGMWQQGNTEYGWFAEAMNFAAQAANITGDKQEVALNEIRSRQYFEFAMQKMVKDYRLLEFRTVNRGEAIPNGVADAPGYMAKITVPIIVGKVPFLGPQTIDVPMRYFAVVRSLIVDN